MLLAMVVSGGKTLKYARTVDSAVQTAAQGVRGFCLDIIEGADDAPHWESTSARCTIGSCDASDLVLRDPTVSRFHCEIIVQAASARIHDLGSVNGVFVDGVKVLDAFLRNGSLIRLGRTALRFQYVGRRVPVARSERTSFGLLVGRSAAMRGMFALLERVAGNDLPVLLEGETGTGKSLAAESIHRESSRSRGPFFMLDCSAVPATLLESELFGHVKGAFSDAVDRAGAFEEADQGTLFLDEIGELPLALQAKLLTVLDRGEFRRVGSNRVRKVDVRLIAATNRDLRAAVNAGRFREDLYFRIAVLPIELPPLRERLDDLADLVRTILARSRLEPTAAQLETLTGEAFLGTLRASAWPGNIRELKNHLERCLAFGLLDTGEEAPAPAAAPPAPPGPGARVEAPVAVPVCVELPYKQARRRLQHEFERIYLSELLRLYRGNVSRAAEAAGIGREYYHRLIRVHDIQRSSPVAGCVSAPSARTRSTR